RNHCSWNLVPKRGYRFYLFYDPKGRRPIVSCEKTVHSNLCLWSRFLSLFSFQRAAIFLFRAAFLPPNPSPCQPNQKLFFRLALEFRALSGRSLSARIFSDSRRFRS